MGVSGFNIEYGGGGFALIFMAEYGRILVMSILTGIFFFGASNFGTSFGFFLVIKGFFFCFFFSLGTWEVAAYALRLSYDAHLKEFSSFFFMLFSFCFGLFGINLVSYQLADKSDF